MIFSSFVIFVVKGLFLFRLWLCRAKIFVVNEIRPAEPMDLKDSPQDLQGVRR